MIHELKCWPQFFNPTVLGYKTFEYRLNDRDYKAGDTLHLKEYLPAQTNYTGRWCEVKVRHVFKDIPGMPEDYVLMEIVYFTHGG